MKVPKLVIDAIEFRLGVERTDCVHIPTEIEWAMLAAYIDGEGCMQIVRNYRDVERQMPSYKLHVGISNTNPELVQWCKRRFGGRAYLLPNYQEGSNRKPSYRWEVNGRVATRVLRHCFSYFVIKSEQANICLLFSKISNQKRLAGYSREDLVRSREVLRHTLQRLIGMTVAPDFSIVKEVKRHAA